MAIIDDAYGSWERLHELWIWEFRDEGIRVNIQFFLLDSGAKVEIQTSLKPLLNELIVKWNPPDLVKGLRDKIVWPIFFIHFLPFLELFGSEEEFSGRVIGLVVAG